jgi:hypothetical protein
MGDGLINRMIRALRLDRTLYREVAAPDARTEEAALVVALAAVGFSFAGSAGSLVSWLNGRSSGLTPTQANFWAAIWIENGKVAVSVLALVAAWPIWAACVWLVSKCLVAPGHRRPGYGQVARLLAFAQAPGVLGPGLLLPVTIGVALILPHSVTVFPEDPSPLAILNLLTPHVYFLLTVWVILGTVVALSEGLGFSYGQALGALFVIAAGLAVLLGLVVAVGSVVAAGIGLVPNAFGHEPPLPIRVGQGDGIVSQVGSRVPYLTAYQFDLNLGLHFSPALMSSLSGALATVR